MNTAKAWAAIGITGAMVMPAAQARGDDTVSFTLLATGAEVVQTLPAGVYVATVSGTYDYDIDDARASSPGWTTLADAECSTDTVQWRSLVDQVALDEFDIGYDPLYPEPLSVWQRYRFGVRAEEDVPPVGTFTTNPVEDALDVYVNGLEQSWVPADPSPQVESSMKVGCDTTTHTYSTVLLSTGQAMKFRIFDVDYSDNAGSLAVTIAPA